MTDYREYITANPKIMLGKACVKGTRITVELILDLLSQGVPISEIMTMYPHVPEEGIFAAIRYAYEAIAHEELLDVTE
jgi:uncharacterized protein (DUF433 family)